MQEEIAPQPNFNQTIPQQFPVIEMSPRSDEKEENKNDTSFDQLVGINNDLILRFKESGVSPEGNFDEDDDEVNQISDGRRFS